NPCWALTLPGSRASPIAAMAENVNAFRGFMAILPGNRPRITASIRGIERPFCSSPACGGGSGRGPLRESVPWNCPLPNPPPQAGEGTKTKSIVGGRGGGTASDGPENQNRE